MPTIKKFLKYRRVEPATQPLRLNRDCACCCHLFITNGPGGDVPNLFKVVLSTRADLPLNGRSGGICVKRIAGHVELGKMAMQDDMAKGTRCLCLTHIDSAQAHMYLVPLECLTDLMNSTVGSSMFSDKDYALMVMMTRWRHGIVQKGEAEGLFKSRQRAREFIKEIQW